MGQEDSLERGETTSLLVKNPSSRQFYDDQSSDKPSSWKAPLVILVSRNLAVYLNVVLHESNTSNAANVSMWGGTCYFTPLLGAAIADTYWGNYKTILVSVLIYLSGMATITMSSLAPSLKPSPWDAATPVQNLVFFSGMYLIAIGSGGIKSALLPLGADQFDEEDPTEREKKGRFFSHFYISNTIGLLASGTFIVWIEDNISWALGLGIATSCLGLAFLGFVAGTPTYRLRMPRGSPLKSILQVLVASLRKSSTEVPTDESRLYEEEAVDDSSDYSRQQRLAHTQEFRCLDKAATIMDSEFKDGDPHGSWGLCTVTQVEELKILLRLLPIWITEVFYSVAYSQMFTTFVEQGTAMNTKIGSFSIPPASLSSFEVIGILVWALAYDKIIAPTIKRHFGNGVGLSQLQRIGVGRFLIILTMASAALLEGRRLERMKRSRTTSILWQLPQYLILSGSEVFNFISLLEFFYGQAPASMKSLCTAFALLTGALGKYLNSLIVMLVALTTTAGGRAGWIPDDLNQGHLDYLFWGLTALCTLNFLVFLAVARNYKLKKVIAEC